MATSIADMGKAIITSQKEHWEKENKRDRLRGLCKVIRQCDGSVNAEVREWMEEVEMTIPHTSNIENGTVKICERTVTGSLKKEIERFLQQQEDRSRITWTTLRDHIKKSFLSANENERLKSELEKLQQSSYEGLGVYNRKFREAANKAYPSNPRSDDAERIIVRAYARGLYSSDLRKKLIVEERPNKLEAAIKYTEHQDAGLEVWRGITTEDRDIQPMEINPLNPSPPMTSQQAALDINLESIRLLKEISQKQERMSTRIAKLEASMGNIRLPKDEGRSKCFYCKKPGHQAKDCYKKKSDEAARQNPGNRQRQSHLN